MFLYADHPNAERSLHVDHSTKLLTQPTSCHGIQVRTEVTGGKQPIIYLEL